MKANAAPVCTFCEHAQTSALGPGSGQAQASSARVLRKITPTAPGEAARALPRVRMPQAVAAALRRSDGDAGQATLRAAFVAQYSGDSETVWVGHELRLKQACLSSVAGSTRRNLAASQAVHPMPACKLEPLPVPAPL